MVSVTSQKPQDLRFIRFSGVIFIIGLAGFFCVGMVQNKLTDTGTMSARFVTRATWCSPLHSSPYYRRNLAHAMHRLNGQIIPAQGSLELTQALGPWLDSDYQMAPATEGPFVAAYGSGAQIVAKLACKVAKAAHLRVQEIPSDPRSPAPPGCNYLFINPTKSAMRFTARWEHQNLSVTLAVTKKEQKTQSQIPALPASQPGYILALGDVATDSRVAPAAIAKPEKIKSLLHNWQGPDCFSICNLETPVTQSSHPTKLKTQAAIRTKQEFIFRGTPAVSQKILHSLGIDAVTTANNHVFDQSATGMKQMATWLNKQDIGFAGPVSSDKAQVLRFTLGNSPWSLLSFCTTETVPANVSTYLGRGWLLGVSEKQIKKSCAYVEAVIQKEQAAGRSVIVAFHWGQEAVNTQNRSQQILAGTASEAGAAIIIGHHPHRLQPFESINGSLVAYSLGNFVFAPGKPAQANTGILVIETRNGKPVAAGLLPVRCDPGGLPEAVPSQGRYTDAILQDLGLLPDQ